jgi:hypothetical protein
VQPELTLLGLEVINAEPDAVKKLRIKVYRGSNMAPELLFDSGKGGGALAFTCNCTIKVSPLQ